MKEALLHVVLMYEMEWPARRDTINSPLYYNRRDATTLLNKEYLLENHQ